MALCLGAASAVATPSIAVVGPSIQAQAPHAAKIESFQLVAGKPGAASSKTIRGNTIYTLAAALGDPVTGKWATGSQVRALPLCSTTATVLAADGTTLLKKACMNYSVKSGKAFLNWVVSPQYRGAAVIHFMFTIDGRLVSERKQTFSIVK